MSMRGNGLPPYTGRLDKCNRKGCLDIVVAKPVLVVPAPPDEKEQIRVRLNLPVCKRHMSPKVRLYLSADGKATILKVMRSQWNLREEPRWNRAWIEFEPIGMK